MQLVTTLQTATVQAPVIDWDAISPLLSLTGGACGALAFGVIGPQALRRTLAFLTTTASLLVTIYLVCWQWSTQKFVLSNAIVIDGFTLVLTVFICVAALAALLLAHHEESVDELGAGEYCSLLLASVLGMVVLVASENLVTVFIGFELLSIPLYVLCASALRRRSSLESGLKYLIIGSLGSATLLYGLALLYGASGTTDFTGINQAIAGGQAHNDLLVFGGIALVIIGLGFKATLAPFHQWSPDVYQGAPTPITAFMSAATKIAAFGLLIRLFDVALLGSARTWAPIVATIAVVSIVVGNTGALGQSSLKRLIAFSAIAQAGYLLAGLVVTTTLGIRSVVFYLGCYLIMIVAAFTVVAAIELELGSDKLRHLKGLLHNHPLLAWPLTIAMLGLAGIPATAGFFGKFYLIQAAVDNGYGWLAVVIVIGSAISLAPYLRVITTMWDQRRPVEDATPAAPRRRSHKINPLTPAAVGAAILTVAIGVYPQPLFELANHAARGFNLF